MHITDAFSYQRGARVRLPSSIKEGPGVVPPQHPAFDNGFRQMKGEGENEKAQGVALRGCGITLFGKIKLIRSA
jgi:hypothetical protein